MRVNQSGNNPVQNSETSGAKKAERSAQAKEAKNTSKSKEASQAVSSGDVATNISSRGKDLAKAKSVAQAAPDVREEKIAELKNRIASGKYKVDADAVAGKMADEHLKMGGA